MYWLFDPGHAWLVVPKGVVEKSGAEISVFSYEHRGVVFLEEDCDAPAFVEAAGLDRAVVGQYPCREGDPRGYATYSGAVA